MRKEWRQFWAQPSYWSLFILAELAFLFASSRVLESWQDIPSMIFFIMAFSLLFLLFGAEQARQEERNHVGELIASLPKGTSHYLGKGLYWIAFVFLWYVVFVMSLLFFLTTTPDFHWSGSIIEVIGIYTFFNWYVPFLFSIVLGYGLYTLWPSLVTYVALIAAWILFGPYNHFIALLPSSWSEWLSLSDTNFEITQHIFVTEHMIVNNGALWQRALAMIASIVLYILVVPVLRKRKIMRTVIPALLIGIILIPLLAPSQKITDIARNMTLESNPYGGSDYTIESYAMEIRHERNDHRFEYSADVKLHTQSERVTFALWGTMQVKALRWNGQTIPYQRSGNWMTASLPAPAEGTVHFEVDSDTYSDVNPTSFELLPTLPWYPMNPEEALDPLGHARKESYSIRMEGGGLRDLVTNLAKGDDHTLSGQAYGPTLLRAHYENDGAITRLINYPEAQVDRALQTIRRTIDKINSQSGQSIELPSRVYFVSSASILSANPDECFITPIPISMETIIRRNLFHQ